MRSFALLALFALSAAAPLNCTEDIARGALALGEAGVDIAKAVVSCAGSDKAKCAQDIADVVDNLSKATTDVTNAVGDCGGPHEGAACADDIANTASSLSAATADISAAVDDCNTTTVIGKAKCVAHLCTIAHSTCQSCPCSAHHPRPSFVQVRARRDSGSEANHCLR